MATYNPRLEKLSLEEIEAVSIQYLRGWQDLLGEGYGFRVKGLNRRRQEYGLEPLTREWSNQYRLDYIRSHFTQEEIDQVITDYLQSGRVGDARWTGIFLFDCRFGREYVKLFRTLMGSVAYLNACEAARVKKLTETQVDLYGGMGLASAATREKVQNTVFDRCGVSNVMQAEAVKERFAAVSQKKYGGVSPFCSKDVRARAEFTKWKQAQAQLQLICKGARLDKLLKSKAEAVVYLLLVQRFGQGDVFYEYGIHPSDKRYPHNCDFYIKSLDLFIELHGHYSHGNHWFDANCLVDNRRLSQLMVSGRRGQLAAKTWSETDLRKREDARRSNIKYLVFWDGSTASKKQGSLPNLSDFYQWFYDYDCDYEAFIKDYPGCTY